MSGLVPVGGPIAPRPEITAVPFLDGHIPCAVVRDEPMVILKPVSDLLGLNWAGQYTKLSADQTACVEFISMQIPGDDQTRRHMVIDLETFAVWLARLQPSRIKAVARETVITYQREAGRVLRRHFFGAVSTVAKKPNDDLDLLDGILASLRADRARVAVLEAEQKALAAKVSAIEGQHDWFTALGYAKLHDHPTDRPSLAKVGKRATAIMRGQGRQPERRQDATFGAINVYPIDVLAQAFGGGL